MNPQETTETCVRGHARTDATTGYNRANGRTYCRVCAREDARKFREMHKDDPAHLEKLKEYRAKSAANRKARRLFEKLAAEQAASDGTE